MDMKNNENKLNGRFSNKKFVTSKNVSDFSSLFYFIFFQLFNPSALIMVISDRAAIILKMRIC